MGEGSANLPTCSKWSEELSWTKCITSQITLIVFLAQVLVSRWEITPSLLIQLTSCLLDLMTTSHRVILAVSMCTGMCKAMPCPEGQVCEDDKGQPGLYLVQKQARQVLSADSSTREAEALPQSVAGYDVTITNGFTSPCNLSGKKNDFTLQGLFLLISKFQMEWTKT